ncbi:MAG: hypothetical protein ACE5IK_02630, partial [Acidobacteriota bacterium]
NQSVAVLVYSGPRADGEREFNDGRYSLVTVPRSPADTVLFLREEVWPALSSGSLSTGTLRGLPRDVVPGRDDQRLDALERNLLRAVWYPRLVAAGLRGTHGPVGRFDRQDRARRFQREVIEEFELNGLLHEAQHALDEAPRVDPRYRPSHADRATAESRALLAALAHSRTPHYVLYHAVRQYRQGIQPYDTAFADVVSGLAGAAAVGPPIPGVRSDRNLLLQIPRMRAGRLRDLAAAAMAARFASTDRAAGYHLDYSAHAVPEADLRLSNLRGTVRPADIPVADPQDGVLASWRIAPAGVETAGVRVYFSPEGVQVARRDRLGLVVDGEGFVAVHLRAPEEPGPWTLHLSGGQFAAGDAATRVLPLEAVIGDRAAIRLERDKDPGTFSVSVPSTAVRDGLLRLVFRRRHGPGPAAFFSAFSLSSDPD